MDTPVDYFYGESLRWGFGFENPNKAAVIFACLFPLCWLLGSLTWRIKSPWLKWLCCMLTGGVVLADAFCLFKTYSRGGAVAALAGTLYLIWRTTSFEAGWMKNIHCGKFYSGSFLGILVLALFCSVGLGERSLEPVANDDPSVSHRLILWRSALEMAVDNPHGFGRGHSGEAYMQWYQPLEITAGYRTMVNSYLTFLVERGWLLSALFVFSFSLFWFWAVPSRDSLLHFEIMMGWRASILAFLVSGFFSTVMEEPLLWIIPGLCLIFLTVGGILSRAKSSFRQLCGAGLGSVLILLALYTGGIVQRVNDPFTHTCGTIEGRNTITGIGLRRMTTGSTSRWIVIPDREILGENYGKLLRQWVLQSGVQLKIQDKVNRATTNQFLLLVGKAVQSTPIASSLPVLLVSPAVISDDQAEQWVKACPHLLLLVPSIDEDGRARFWEEKADSVHLSPNSIVKLEGVGLRIDWDWPDVIRMTQKFH